MLTQTIEFLDGKRSPSGILFGKRMPLAACGNGLLLCWSTGTAPTLACSRCRCVRYCGSTHQKSVSHGKSLTEGDFILTELLTDMPGLQDWKTHKLVCVAPTWIEQSLIGSRFEGTLACTN